MSTLRQYKPCLAYKDSGVERLGEIPDSWGVKRSKYAAAEPIKNGVGEASDYDNPEGLGTFGLPISRIHMSYGRTLSDHFLLRLCDRPHSG
jgi:hypothetical protein